MGNNPCLHCGACCALFRASFYWAETDACTRGGVPAEMTYKLTDFLAAMKGTELRPPRCAALAGEIGRQVCCSIYDQRSSVCREFEPSWQNHQSNPRCNQARLAWGLQPLSRDSWHDTSGFPKAA
ncbi:MAG: YkgJ family cysteine cluster protein [Desulfobacterales bacterium]|nr:YkgJ family cysteine cluster protein [Desulfobacterales bacterium]